MTSKFHGKLLYMHMKIEGCILPGGKADLRSFTLSGLSHNIYPSWIDITTSEHNQEVALCLQELTSALPS